MQYAIGIDIGGTTTKYGLVSRAGKISVQDVMPSDTHASVQDFIDELYDRIMPMVEKVGGKSKITGIGVGAPNGNFYKGTIEYAPNLKWKGIIHFADLMEKKFELPSTLTNDANAAALGEMIYGSMQKTKDFIMITLGTGVGSGIVIDGKMVLGSDGFAGELGHTIIRPGGRLHKGTNMRGSLEVYCSATGVTDTALEMLGMHPTVPSILRNYSINELSSKTVFEAAVQGDQIANEIFDYTGQILGEALANFIMFSSPSAIVLFGGLTKAGELLLKPTRRSMEENLLPIFQNKVKLIVSALPKSDAAILGASALVWDPPTYANRNEQLID